MTSSGEQLADEFRDSIVLWDSLVETDAKSANALFDRIHAIAKRLRTTPGGQLAMERLTGDDSRAVRLLAATECLAWDSEIAVPVLEEIEDGPGLLAVDAKYTLKSFRAGTLNLDW